MLVLLSLCGGCSLGCDVHANATDLIDVVLSWSADQCEQLCVIGSCSPPGCAYRKEP